MTPDDIRKRAGRIRTLNPSADGREECELLLSLADVVEAQLALKYFTADRVGNQRLIDALAHVEALKP